MQRFLNIYWVIYLAVYVIAVGFLMWWYWGELLRGDGLTRVYLLAAIFGTAAGGASVFAVFVELGGRLVLLIPARVKELKDAGRKEGRAEGREIGREEGIEIGREEGIEIGREEGRGEGREEGRGEGREEGRVEGRGEGIEERDKRYAEARERFGRYDANGEFVLPYSDEVRRFLAGEDVVPNGTVNRWPPRRNRRNRRPR